MDDVILQKVKSIERCLQRVKEEYALGGEQFKSSFSHQDAAILNLQRACEQSIDLANHIIRLKKWGIPDSSRASFDILGEKGLISEELAGQMKKMIGFRNLAVHEYSNLDINILVSIIENQLDDFSEYTKTVLKTEL